MLSMSWLQRRRQQKQKGAFVVELALSMLVFLLVLLGILDFTLMMFKMIKGVDVARETARQVMVDDPLTDLSVLNGCDELSEIANKTSAINCSGDCDDYAETRLEDYVVGDITVTYGCSLAGNLNRARFSDDLLIPQIRVDVLVRYQFFFSSLLFGENAYTLNRTFSVTRTGEDMDSV